jgi:hypothetical protein
LIITSRISETSIKEAFQTSREAPPFRAWEEVTFIWM